MDHGGAGLRRRHDRDDAATQSSIEDIVNGGIPWTPRVNLHNPFLSSETGDDFLRRFHLAAEGKVGPFILVVEGSIPNEKAVGKELLQLLMDVHGAGLSE